MVSASEHPAVRGRDEHRLVRAEHLRRLGHEVHAAEHDRARVGAGRDAGQRERVADVVGDVLDQRILVVVRQDDRVAFPRQPVDLVLPRLACATSTVIDAFLSLAVFACQAITGATDSIAPWPPTGIVTWSTGRAIRTRCSRSCCPCATAGCACCCGAGARRPSGAAGRCPGAGWTPDERLREAIARHLATKVDVRELAHLEQLATHSAVDRDPRTRVLATAYLGLVPSDVDPQLPSDTAWHPVDELPRTGVRPPLLHRGRGRAAARQAVLHQHRLRAGAARVHDLRAARHHQRRARLRGRCDEPDPRAHAAAPHRVDRAHRVVGHLRRATGDGLPVRPARTDCQRSVRRVQATSMTASLDQPKPPRLGEPGRVVLRVLRSYMCWPRSWVNHILWWVLSK